MTIIESQEPMEEDNEVSSSQLEQEKQEEDYVQEENQADVDTDTEQVVVAGHKVGVRYRVSYFYLHSCYPGGAALLQTLLLCRLLSRGAVLKVRRIRSNYSRRRKSRSRQAGVGDPAREPVPPSVPQHPITASSSAETLTDNTITAPSTPTNIEYSTRWPAVAG